MPSRVEGPLPGSSKVLLTLPTFRFGSAAGHLVSTSKLLHDRRHLFEAINHLVGSEFKGGSAGVAPGHSNDGKSCRAGRRHVDSGVADDNGQVRPRRSVW